MRSQSSVLMPFFSFAGSPCPFRRRRPQGATQYPWRSEREESYPLGQVGRKASLSPCARRLFFLSLLGKGAHSLREARFLPSLLQWSQGTLARPQAKINERPDSVTPIQGTHQGTMGARRGPRNMEKGGLGRKVPKNVTSIRETLQKTRGARRGPKHMEKGPRRSAQKCHLHTGN